MDALRTFMFEHVYLGPSGARASTRKIERVAAHAVRLLLRAPERAARRRRRAGRRRWPQRVTDYLAGMTDRYCIRAFEALTVPRGVRALGWLMARYTDDSRERVRDAVDMVDLVGARDRAAARRRAAATRGCARSTTSARRRSAIDPVEKLYHCFGCGEGGDAFKFVQETEGLDFAGALEYLADRYGVELERRRGGPARRPSAREQRERLLELLERTAAFYVRVPVGVGRGGGARASTSPARGLEEATLREFRVGYAPSAWDTVLRRLAPRRASRDRELVAAGLASARAKERRGSTTASAGGSCSRCATRAGACSASARARCGADQQPKYLNSSDGDVFHKGRHALRRRPRARAGGARRARSIARRGLHRRDRAAPGRAAQRGRARWARR